MRVESINQIQNSRIKVLKNNKVTAPQEMVSTSSQNFVFVSFKGNPSKNPSQVAFFATESNFLGGIYTAGGLGDVAEALPDSMANKGEEVLGKKIDARTFLPYYTMDDGEGRIYVAKKDAVEKFQNGKMSELVRNDDFKLVDQNYKLQEGESFALITQVEGQGGQKIKKMFLLNDVNSSGKVDRMALTGMKMESIPYRTFEVVTNGARKDRIYIIHTSEMASGKAAYGIYGKYQNVNGSAAYGGSQTYGGSVAYGTSENANKLFRGRAAGDIFFTEQIRAFEQNLKNMNTETHGNFVPQNIGLHDRFGYVFLSDAVQQMNKDSYYQGLKFVPIFHNPGRTYQGVFGNPLDFFRIIATKEDFEKLKADPNFEKIKKIDSKIAKGSATARECTNLYKFFKPYLQKFMDAEDCFNMTKIAVAATKDYSGNTVPGNVSRYFGKETRDFATEDIAKGLTQDLIDIEKYTVDVVNGVKPANMATGKQDGFFGYGILNQVFKDVNDTRKYTPYNSTDPVNKVYKAKEANKKNLINIIADATRKLEEDKDALTKIFLSEADISKIRENPKAKDLRLTLGGLSDFSEGDKLIVSWGRPDPQKGLKATLRAYRMFLEDATVPLETRLHTKMLVGAGKNQFFDGHTEWEGIKSEMKKIANIEVDGKKGIFKDNAAYFNIFFPNRLANCADVSLFTSRWEPCGITPFESMAAGTPVINIKSGGAPDFIKHGETGLITEFPFMLSPDKLGLDKNIDAEVLDEARCEHCAKDTEKSLKEFFSSVQDGTYEAKQKKYIENCFKEKIEWHNNNAYNGGQSALELYSKVKFNTQNNDVPTSFNGDLRGKFDSDAFKKPPAVSGGKGGKGGKFALISAIVLGVGAAIYAVVRQNKKKKEQTENIELNSINQMNWKYSGKHIDIIFHDYDSYDFYDFDEDDDFEFDEE